MSLKQKIFALVGLPILSLALLIGFGSWSITNISHALESLVNDQFLVLIDEDITPLIQEDMLPLINEDIARMQAYQKSIALMLEADRDVHQAVIAEKMSLVANQEEEMTAADNASKENIEQARKRMANASEHFIGAEAKSTYGKFVTAFNNWEEQTRKVVEMSNSPTKLIFARKMSDGGSAQKSFDDMRDLIDKLQTIQQADIDVELANIAAKRDRINAQDERVKEKRTLAMTSAKHSEEEAAAVVPMFFGTGIVVAALLTLVGFLTARSITRPISQISELAVAVANGDVNQDIEVRSKDEIGKLAGAFRQLVEYMKGLASAAESIASKDLRVTVNPKSDHDVLGQSFKTMVANLTSMIRQIGENAEQLVAASTEIASTSEQMAHGANSQSEQITQISAAVEQMSSAIAESSRNSSDASEASKAASDTAGEGGRIIQDSMDGMQRIQSVVKESADNIQKLAESATQIGEIIGVIDDIADQTNLLALNAAIEAARAGEQGRGFAVVADEVRKLAERTGKATNEITTMIKTVQTNTEDAVVSMESGLSEVATGRELSDKAGNSLSQIVSMSDRVMDMIRQVSVASEEQAATAEEIARNIDSILAVTKETAKGTEQSAAAAEQLSRQAESLKVMVSEFEI
ncbi:MAG: methyl-accepting chemotaxis protein [Candidatus Zixiibacteriota bacterium]